MVDPCSCPEPLLNKQRVKHVIVKVNIHNSGSMWVLVTCRASSCSYKHVTARWERTGKVEKTDFFFPTLGIFSLSCTKEPLCGEKARRETGKGFFHGNLFLYGALLSYTFHTGDAACLSTEPSVVILGVKEADINSDQEKYSQTFFPLLGGAHTHTHTQTDNHKRFITDRS